MFQDKYFGRKVTIEDFPSVLGSFLSDGKRVLAYQIPHILHQLYGLATIVFSLDRYRFYAASLLFIYDGDSDAQEEYRTGLERSGLPKLGHLSDTDQPNAGAVAPFSYPPSQHPNNGHTPKHRLRTKRKHKHKAPAGAVSIRLIDFAHCTTGDDFLLPEAAAELFEGRFAPGDVALDGRAIARFPPTHPNQPDLGFLLGLKSLCTALRMIWRQEGGGELHVEGEQVWTQIWGEQGGEDQGLGRGVTPDSAYELATA